MTRWHTTCIRDALPLPFSAKAAPAGEVETRDVHSVAVFYAVRARGKRRHGGLGAACARTPSERDFRYRL